MKFFVAHNSDQTEGKGQDVLFGVFDNADDAEKAVQGMGVMGVGTGSIYVPKPDDEVRALFVPPANSTSRTSRVQFSQMFTRVYGYRKNWLGKWDNGWLDLRDAPVNDPEYNEYQRLQKEVRRSGLGVSARAQMTAYSDGKDARSGN